MRYPALDGLRGFAAFLVVISHFSNRTDLLGGMFGSGGGQLGVMIFFLISGFLMGRLYMEDPFDRAALRAFAQKRIARVIPLYLFMIAISAAASLGLGSESPLYPVTRANLVGHLLFLHGVWALWTIPVEIHFYLLFP
jgi:peptidoglycan/LPS O-acetylase OafA/YrhL